jgi:predicted transcriptional regulator
MQIVFDLSRGTSYDELKEGAMDMIPLKPERKAQLEEYAKRRGQDPAAALDALATYLEWERQDFAEAVEGIRQGYEDVKAGRTRPAGEFLADLRRKHDLPR